jgi:altronate dehydratase small subunit
VASQFLAVAMSISRDGAALRLKDNDNVAVCLRAVPAGAELEFEGRRIVALAPIPAGHKIALRPIAEGELILKYGQTIGRAGVEIQAGEHVHVHNVEGTRGRGDLAQLPAAGTRARGASA